MGKEIIDKKDFCFNSVYKHMIELKKTFTVKTTGQSGGKKEIIFPSGNGYSFRNIIAGQKISVGTHLSNLVLKNVTERIESGLYKPINTDNERSNIKTVFFNLENIRKNLLGIPIWALDYSSCYYNTAKIIGAIDQRTYDFGFPINKTYSEYKVARNIAIGSLGTDIKETQYLYDTEKQQYMISKKKYKRPTNIVRLDIIDYVWKIANEISVSDKIKKDFCMFLTDCFFIADTGNGSIEKIEKISRELGYTFKKELCYFTNLVTKGISYKLHWVKASSISTTSVGKDKFMCFGIKDIM